MRFLIDNNLSPLLGEFLKAAGHDAVHIRDYGLQGATDPIVLAQARDRRASSSLRTPTSGQSLPATKATAHHSC